MGVWRSCIRCVGSLWLAVVLLVLLLVAMVAASAFESRHGSEAALALFYHATWFKALLALLGLNVLAAMAARFPFTRRRIGFVLTHASVLAVLIGAAVTDYCGLDGQVGILEGDKASELRLTRPGVRVDPGDGRPVVWLDLDPRLSGRRQAVDWPGAATLSLDGVRLTVQRYLPDSRESTQVLNDAPRPRAAVEVRLQAEGRTLQEWVFADEEAAPSGEASLRLQVVADAPALARILEAAPASQPASAGTVHLEIEGRAYAFPVESCTSQPAAVGGTGYTIRVLRYLPEAIVGPDLQVRSVSSRPVNPAIEAEIVGPGGTSRRLAFARFPGFQAGHGAHPGREPDAGIRLTFAAAPPPEPIRIYAAGTGQLGVVFTPDDGAPVATPVAVGSVVPTPWPGMRFEILRVFDHARRERLVVPVEPVRPGATPAVLLAGTPEDRFAAVWLRKGEVESRGVGGATWRLEFTDRAVPLGFEVALERFRIGRYPGTQRPRSFESHVTFLDPGAGGGQSRVISMNRPASHGGYTFYQSSYRTEPDGRTVSFLSVSRDPGRPIVFAGYIGMLIGMVWVLVQRLLDRRRAGPPAGEASTTQEGSGG